MQKSRVETFSDGVIAIIITILVLQLKVPNGSGLSDLIPLYHIMLYYLLSFLYLATYWNNHHHLFQTVKEINGKILWANIYLLFWLSLIPFVTKWAGESHFSNLPTALYGFVLLMAACAYAILTKSLIAEQGDHSLLATAIGKDWKGKLSILLYAIAIAVAFWLPILGFLIYIVVALIWLIPDTRIEKKLVHKRNH